MTPVEIKGLLVDPWQQKIYAANLLIESGKIKSITSLPEEKDSALPYILPGFVDSHVHIESSMLVPSSFAEMAVPHGTVGTVSDPHEIANVCGIRGVEFMIENGRTVPFKFNFGAPSCVPATSFETAGAELNAEEVEKLLEREDIKYLSEVMNFPGVLKKDDELMRKIRSAHRLDKPVDGHAPGLRGEAARQYVDAGISTDHECFTYEEALEKIRYGMKILIREGSAARNFDALIDLLNDYPDRIMFCSDDKHPDSLLEGHINQLCARAAKKGIDIFSIVKAACVNPVLHYKLDIGLLREADPADLILVRDLEQFEVLATYIDGEKVAENGKAVPGCYMTAPAPREPLNNFSITEKETGAFRYDLNKWGNEEESVEQVYVIEALDGQLVTNKQVASINDIVIVDGCLYSNTNKDILKIVVINRYEDAPIAKSFVRNFGLKRGAMASSVAHDSHNIIAVGVDDESISRAVNLLIEARGGLSFYAPHHPKLGGEKEFVIPLPVAGLMSFENGEKVAKDYTAMTNAVKDAGSTLAAPFMTLSFMALLVIPSLKLSDKGLFDGDNFSLVS